MFEAFFNSQAFAACRNEAPFNKLVTVDTPYSLDETFEDSIRALVTPRMGNDDTLTLSSLGYTNPAEISRISVENHIIICYPVGSASTADSAYDVCNCELSKAGWQELHRITEYFKTLTPVHCFVSPEQRTVILHVRRITLKIWHALQAPLLTYFPWYFNPKEDKISEAELSLMQSFTRSSLDDFVNAMRTISTELQLKSKRVQAGLRGFEQRASRRRLETLRNQYARLISDIQELNSKINDRLRNVNESNAQIRALEMALANESPDEMLEFFSAHQQLDVLRYNDNVITFGVKGVCSGFDPEQAEAFINEPGGYLSSSRLRNSITVDEMRKLLISIFVDQTLRIQFCAAYNYTNGGTVEAQSGFEFGLDYFDAMPNPHIQHYACMGAYNATINEAFMNGDKPFAFELVIASAASLNFGDSAVMESFIADMYKGALDRNAKFILLPDGKNVNIVEAIEWLRNEEALQNE